MIEGRGVFFLTITKGDRTSIATSIERLIAMLDDLDGDENLEPSLGGYTGIGDDREVPDEDLEPSADDEPTLGANEMNNGESQERWSFTAYGLDELEEENEHGGDILAEPHDHLDSGDDEPFMGWPERCGQRGVGLENWGAGDEAVNHSGGLGFDHSGYRKGLEHLRELRRNRPDVRQERVRVSPGIL